MIPCTRRRPTNAQWVQFLRSHDELDLGRLVARAIMNLDEFITRE